MLKVLNNELSAQAAGTTGPARQQIHPAGVGVTRCIPARNEEQSIAEVIEGAQFLNGAQDPILCGKR